MTLPEAVVTSLLALYPQVCAELSDHFPQPIANEIAKYALVRRAFEDGWNRPAHISVPGLGTGKVVREKIELARKNRELRVSAVVGTEEGQRFIMLEGPEAHVISSVVVGMMFDEFINRQTERQWAQITWLCSTKDPLFAQGNIPMIRSLLQRVNEAYGPGGEALNRAVEEIWGIE